MIFNYLDNPSKTEIENILNSTNIKDLNFIFKYDESEDKSYWDIVQNRSLFNFWTSQFNSKLNEIQLTYFILIHYKSKLASTVQNKQIHSNNFIFNYYLDIFYHKIFSAWDFIFQLINVAYKFNLPNKSGFNKELVKKLAEKNPSLAKHFDDVSKRNAFIKAKKFRNDLTHNYPPNKITYKEEKKGCVTTTKIIDPFEPDKFIENVNDLLDIFIESLVLLKENFINLL